MSQSKVPIPMENSRKQSKKDAYEIHKFLYVTQTLFPPRELRQASAYDFTLPAGKHAYDFSLVIPDRLECQTVKQPGSLSLSRFVIDRSGLDYARSASNHMEGPLPPSLSDVDKHAIVRYFLKVTVSRSSILKTNIRVYKPIIFLPPDAMNYPSHNLLFVRRDAVLTISKNLGPPARTPEKKSSFRSFISATVSPREVSTNVTITFEMRYPERAIFTPLRKGLPLKLFVNGSSSSILADSNIKLEKLTFSLFSITDTRAQSYMKTNTFSLALFERNVSHWLDWSKAVQKPNSLGGNLLELELPESLYKDAFIPDFVPPTFEMCNIKRNYQLEVSGLFTSSNMSRTVSLIANISIMSGLSRHQQPMLPNRPSANVSFPAQQGVVADENGDMPPPSYQSVLSEEGISSAQPGQMFEPRRQFGQAPGYYENLESLDEKH